MPLTLGHRVVQGLKSRWEVLDRFKTKKIAAAERQKNRQIESIKNMFDSELLHVRPSPRHPPTHLSHTPTSRPHGCIHS